MDYKKEIFNNEDNVYFGHGTGYAGNSVINSIYDIGLRCSHGSLYYTSICFGGPKDITDETIELMNNWQHLESKNIVIVSLPLQYNVLLQNQYLTTSAYTYHPKETDLRDYIRPEFIKGCYNANTKEFQSNPKYYENLPQQQQNELFQQVKEKYIDIVNEYFGLQEYANLVTEILGEGYVPLTNEEIKKYNIPKKQNDVNTYAGNQPDDNNYTFTDNDIIWDDFEEKTHSTK